MKRLIAALEGLRANLAAIIADLEHGEQDSALVKLDAAEKKLRADMKDLRS